MYAFYYSKPMAAFIPNKEKPFVVNGGGTRRLAQFKLVLLGEIAVGKSSLVLRFVKGQFHEFQVRF